MSNYNFPSSIKNFCTLRCVTIWAGCLGVVQSLIWMGLTITGILAYNCVISVDKMTYGSLLQTIFYDLYFKGSCTPNGYLDYNDTILKSVTTVLDPTQVLVWDCVYLGVAFVWLITSVLLITHVKKNNVKRTLGVMYTWVIITLFICLMDLALGIMFGIDYGNFTDKAYGYNANNANSGTVIPNAVQLFAAMVTSVSLMIISFKGFILWIVNFGLLIYLTAKAVKIANDIDGNDTLFMPRKESDDVLTTRPPIIAFEEQKTVAYNNEAFVADSRSVDTIELNQEAIARAARMSTDVTLQDRRFRNLDAFQQYPPPRSTSNNNNNNNNNYRPELVKQETITIVPVNTGFPAPDYTPPMSRANHTQSQNQNAILRNNQKY